MPLNRRGSVSARLSVWFSRVSARAKRLEVDLEHLEAARVMLAERRLALDHVQRRPLLRAGLGERQRAVREIERRQRVAAGELGAAWLRACRQCSAARDHEVQDEPQVVLEADRDALAEPAQPADPFAVERADRGLRPCAAGRGSPDGRPRAADPGCAAPALRCTGRRRAAPAWAELWHGRAAVPSPGAVSGPAGSPRWAATVLSSVTPGLDRGVCGPYRNPDPRLENGPRVEPRVA